MTNSDFQPLDPTTLEPLPPVTAATADELDAAAETSATSMTGSWPRDHRRRSEVMQAWADLIRDESDLLITQLVRETGKSRTEARTEISGSIDALRFNAGLARLPLGSAGSLHDGSEAHLVREPVGPTVFITPWNWPILLLLRDLAPAFAAGVTALVKPAPQTTGVTERVITLGHRAGIPVEVLQCLPGGADVGSALVRHPATAAVAITGSTEAGQAVMREAAETMTRPLLELGGKASMLVLPDGDLEAALEQAARAAIVTSGQMCMACTRVLVHQDDLTSAEKILGAAFAEISPADPRKPDSVMGPLVSSAAMAKVNGYLDLARRDARIVVGGEQVHPDGLPGNFLTPALVTDVEPSSRLVQEDIFGPLLTLESYASSDAALELANATPFGLAVSVWSRDLSHAMSAARQLKAGTVWVNGYNRSYSEMPSGGVRMSGLGRTRGVEGLAQFTELKHIHFSI
ncbi:MULTISPECIES: aldehyde dehydrogenase family protein [unclassified Nocardioides]|uniref:aldehyde dehydrogenase family protein n=1 Tax=unclassified Nocardioides TaxID=2615069 RepID=UPI0009EFE157|nr:MULTISPECIES: aldehyde dehydrogenase family protein [unclassified Nocardioides]GAW51827.1 Glycine betaine aldehyde dehydrogenase [Nocardioides sp. PD653-B2]GAW53519.1 Glycine betaine aldehyde dehydrogenase [Nocardioides sp. PD653]